MNIYCTSCKRDVEARLTDGGEVYPHRSDLAAHKFWKCDRCQNHVGCHNNCNKNPKKPMGVIAHKEIKRARQHIHRLIDPLWKEGHMKRSSLYARLSRELGYTYHTGEIRSIEDARNVYRIAQRIAKEILKS